MIDTAGALRKRRGFLEARLEREGLFHTVSAARYQLSSEIRRAIARFGGGDILEAGAGRSPYRSEMEGVSTSLTTLDVAIEREPDVLGDVQNMEAVPSAAYDTVVSTQVLEHVPEPQRAMQEFARVLRPGGVLILSAPHLSMVHEAPNDYYRFTVYGMRALCDSAGLDLIDVHPVGGLLSFLGHIVSLGWLTTLGTIPGFFWPAWATNYVLLVRGLAIVDGILPGKYLLPRDLVLIANRPNP